MTNFIVKLLEDDKQPLITHHAIQISISYTKKGKTANLHFDAVKLIGEKVESLNHVSPSENYIIMNLSRCNIQKLEDLTKSVKSDIEKKRGSAYVMLKTFAEKYNLKIS